MSGWALAAGTGLRPAEAGLPGKGLAIFGAFAGAVFWGLVVGFTAALALLAAFPAGADLAGTGLRGAFRLTVRPARALVEGAALALVDGLLFLTGRLAVGIF